MDNIIYGHHPVVDAIKSGTTVEKLLLQQGTRGEIEKTVRSLSKTYNIPVQHVPKEKMNRLVKGENHQGLIAYISQLTYHKLEELLPKLQAKKENPLLIMLDGVTDVRNFGAIARSAEAFGADAIIVATSSAAKINDIAMKTSAGALAKIPVCRENSLMKTTELLQMNDFQVVASDLKGTTSLKDINFKFPTTVVMGAEDKGVNRALLRIVDERFIIPMNGTTDSFNVSVATGIILYEACR